MNTLEDYIAHHAVHQPDKLAIVCGSDRCTYADLNARIEARAGQIPTPPSAPFPVPLRATPTIDFLVTYFALHRLGLVAAPLERDMPDDTFRQVSDFMAANTCPTGTADVLYTTGTTGRSKGVMISHRTILADAENLIAGQGFSPDLTFVVNGPLNHIGSLSKVYPVMLLGATLIIVDGLKDLDAFFSAFTSPVSPKVPEATEATVAPEAPVPHKFATFLVPASIRILLQLAPDRLAALADRIDFIETGAAAMAQADMEALCRLLPHSRLYNTYASTETGIICTHNFNAATVPDASPAAPTPGCLGRPMPHSRVFITPDGLIACVGDTLMTGYLGDPDRTATVLRDGVLYTADAGTIDEEGRLHLQGRKDDVINVGGFKVAPTEVEDAAMAFETVSDCICIAVDHKITGKALKLLVALKPSATLNKRALALHLKSRLEAYKVPMLYEQVDSIHRTFNGKLDRKHYSTL